MYHLSLSHRYVAQIYYCSCVTGTWDKEGEWQTQNLQYNFVQNHKPVAYTTSTRNDRVFNSNFSQMVSPQKYQEYVQYL